MIACENQSSPTSKSYRKLRGKLTTTFCNLFALFGLFQRFPCWIFFCGRLFSQIKQPQERTFCHETKAGPRFGLSPSSVEDVSICPRERRGALCKQIQKDCVAMANWSSVPEWNSVNVVDLLQARKSTESRQRVVCRVGKFLSNYDGRRFNKALFDEQAGLWSLHQTKSSRCFGDHTSRKKAGCRETKESMSFVRHIFLWTFFGLGK